MFSSGWAALMARAQARSLVGKTHKIELKMGASGRMRTLAKVVRFEDDAFSLQIGLKMRDVPFGELGPAEIVRLAEAGDELDWRG